MKSNIASTNVSFNFLKGDSDFLSIVLNNINSCVLMLNNRMELHAFNDALKTIFANKANEDLMYMRCGEAIGCAYQVEEAINCGSTSRCCNCDLRLAALNTYSEGTINYKDHIIRPFFNSNNEKVDKHLQFSTRQFKYQKEKYILMIIEDISKFYRD